MSFKIVKFVLLDKCQSAEMLIEKQGGKVL